MTNKYYDAIKRSLDTVDKVEAVLDLVTDQAFDFVQSVRENLEVQLDDAVKNQGKYAQREQQVERIFDFLRTNLGKDFNITRQAGEVPVEEENEPSEPDYTEKVRQVRDYYDKQFGIPIWNNANYNPSKEIVDHVWNQIKSFL